MVENACMQTGVPARVFQYLAVPTDDKELAHAAANYHQNVLWFQPDKEKTIPRDWHAGQHLLHLTKILSTAGIGNARQVWKTVVEFVENATIADMKMMWAKASR